jgi:hypothetical protein
VSPSHKRTETDSVPEILCSPVFRTPGDRQSLRTQWFWLKLYLRNVTLCDLVVRVPDCRSRGPGWIPGATKGLERGSLSLVITIEELLGRNSSGSGLENREYGHGDPLRWPRDTLYRLKLALTSPTSCGRSVGIVRLRTKAKEFFYFLIRSRDSVVGIATGYGWTTEGSVFESR